MWSLTRIRKANVAGGFDWFTDPWNKEMKMKPEIYDGPGGLFFLCSRKVIVPNPLGVATFAPRRAVRYFVQQFLPGWGGRIDLIAGPFVTKIEAVNDARKYAGLPELEKGGAT